MNLATMFKDLFIFKPVFLRLIKCCSKREKDVTRRTGRSEDADFWDRQKVGDEYGEDVDFLWRSNP